MLYSEELVASIATHEYLVEARKFMHSKPRRSLYLLEKLLRERKEASRSAVFWGTASIVYRKLDEKKLALKAARRSYRIDPWARPLTILIQALIANGETSSALRAAKKLVILSPNARNLGTLTKAYLADGKKAEATSTAEQAARRYGSAIDYGILTQAYLANFMPEKAVEAARKALDLKNNLHGYIMLVQSLLANHEDEEALTIAETAYCIEENGITACYLTKALMANGLPKSAVIIARKQADKSNDYRDFCILTEALIRDEKPLEAVYAAKEAKKLVARNSAHKKVGVDILLSKALHMSGQEEEATCITDSALSWVNANYHYMMMAKRGRPLVSFIKTLFIRGKISEAKKLAEEAVKIFPRDPVLRKILARIYLENGQTTWAVLHARLGLELCQNHGTQNSIYSKCSITLIQCLFANRKIDEAVEEARKYVETTENTASLGLLAEALRKKKMFQESIAVLSSISEDSSHSTRLCKAFCHIHLHEYEDALGELDKTRDILESNFLVKRYDSRVRLFAGYIFLFREASTNGASVEFIEDLKPKVEVASEFIKNFEIKKLGITQRKEFYGAMEIIREDNL